MKKILSAIALFSLVVSGQAADEVPKTPVETTPAVVAEPTIQELRTEIAELKTTLAKVREESVTYFSASVAVRSKYEAAVQRINEANDVARQWRSQAVNLKHELSYTKAIAMGTTTVDLEKVFAHAKTPRFRISNIPTREEAFVRNDGVSPTFVSLR